MALLTRLEPALAEYFASDQRCRTESVRIGGSLQQGVAASFLLPSALILVRFDEALLVKNCQLDRRRGATTPQVRRRQR